jgi:hypothetical protein
MKNTRLAFLVLWSALGLADTASSATAGTPEELMTKGKLAADLGDRRGAEQAFAKLAADAATPESARAEALVRLGVVQRALGKAQASAATFQKAMQSPGRGAQVTRLLTLALAGVVPDRTRWASEWPKVRLASRSGAAGPHPSIAWPGAGVHGVREALPATDPVTFDLEDVSLPSFLYGLITGGGRLPDGTPLRSPREIPGFENWTASYVSPTAVQGLDVVIHAGVQGQVTVKASNMAWNELFENVLASNGLGIALEKRLIFIARAEELGAIEGIRGRTYDSWPIDLVFDRGNLFDVLSLFRGITDHPFAPDANLQGWVNLRFTNRPALECLDLILVAHDLAITRIAPPGSKPGTTVLRISKLADVRGETVDLSKLGPAASPSQ